MDYDVEITGIGSDFQGVGRLPDGRAIFVPGSIPGERIRVRIDADKGRFCLGELKEILDASPDRVNPVCPHVLNCGGCQGRHMTYEKTLALKRQIVRDALVRIGGLEAPEVLNTLRSPSQNRTRNKAEYSIDEHQKAGVFGRGQILPIEDCLSQNEKSIQALHWFCELPDLSSLRLKYLVTRVNASGKIMLILSGLNPLTDRLKKTLIPPEDAYSLWYCQLKHRYTHALDGVCSRVWGNDVFTDRLNGLTFELSPQSFFQVNTPGAEQLYHCALEMAGIRPGCNFNVLDAYCGAGTISLCAAKCSKSVTGIEIVPPAIENARRNAEINQLQNTHFICADAEQEIPRLLKKGNRYDVAIIDPPRKGADARLLRAIAGARIPTFVYVSCNPATLARDIRIMSGMDYHFQIAQPVDMFPWTSHVETVVLMTKNT